MISSEINLSKYYMISYGHLNLIDTANVQAILAPRQIPV